jgi:glycosyltransferase involved in cell wall biosynthesis
MTSAAASAAAGLRVAIVYDCLYPWTVGGAERWYRGLAEHLARGGYRVTYLTMRQWKRSEPPNIPGVSVVAIAPRMRLYTKSGRRRILPPLAAGLGTLIHLLRHRRDYDVVHVASFPFFPALAAGRAGLPLVVDWHEYWTDAYWRDYLGGVAGRIAARIQAACVRLRQVPVAFSEHTARRLRSVGLDPVVTTGMLADMPAATDARAVAEPPVIISAGRWIKEKRVPLAIEAAARAAERVQGLTLHVFGDGPERTEINAVAAATGSSTVVRGRVDSAEIAKSLSTAAALLVTSEREGYGLVAVEAWATGTPVVTVAAQHNALAERIVPGVNGAVATDDDPDSLARAIVDVVTAGQALRDHVAGWFAEHAPSLSLASSIPVVEAAYARALHAERGGVITGGDDHHDDDRRP